MLNEKTCLQSLCGLDDLSSAPSEQMGPYADVMQRLEENLNAEGACFAQLYEDCHAVSADKTSNKEWLPVTSIHMTQKLGVGASNLKISMTWTVILCIAHIMLPGMLCR